MVTDAASLSPSLGLPSVNENTILIANEQSPPFTFKAQGTRFEDLSSDDGDGDVDMSVIANFNEKIDREFQQVDHESEAKQSTWTCNICTFDNEIGLDVCEVCDTKKPIKATIPQSNANQQNEKSESTPPIPKTTINPDKSRAINRFGICISSFTFTVRSA